MFATVELFWCVLLKWIVFSQLPWLLEMETNKKNNWSCTSPSLRRVFHSRYGCSLAIAVYITMAVHILILKKKYLVIIFTNWGFRQFLSIWSQLAIQNAPWRTETKKRRYVLDIIIVALYQVVHPCTIWCVFVLVFFFSNGCADWAFWWLYPCLIMGKVRQCVLATNIRFPQEDHTANILYCAFV